MGCSVITVFTAQMSGAVLEMLTDVVAQPDPDGTQSLQLPPASLSDASSDRGHGTHTLLLQLQHTHTDTHICVSYLNRNTQ